MQGQIYINSPMAEGNLLNDNLPVAWSGDTFRIGSASEERTSDNTSGIGFNVLEITIPLTTQVEYTDPFFIVDESMAYGGAYYYYDTSGNYLFSGSYYEFRYTTSSVRFERTGTHTYNMVLNRGYTIDINSGAKGYHGYVSAYPYQIYRATPLLAGYLLITIGDKRG